MTRAKVIDIQEEGLRESLRTLRGVKRWMDTMPRYDRQPYIGMPLYSDVCKQVKHLEKLLGDTAFAEDTQPYKISIE